jgi:hypothetical protein
MADGHLNKCKACTKLDVQKNYIKRADQYRAYEQRPARRAKSIMRAKAYAKTATGKLAHAKATKAYRLKYPERYKANTILNNAVRSGKVKRQVCKTCRGKAEAHHDDYSKPLKVQWLCAKDHTHHHRNKGERSIGAPRRYN